MCVCGNVSIVYILIFNGVDVNLSREDGYGFFYFVCENGYFSLV